MPYLTPAVQNYNHLANLYLSGSFLPSHTYRLIALDSSGVIDLSHTQPSQLVGVISHPDWPSTGVALSSATVTTINSNEATLTFSTLNVTASTSDIVGIKHLILVDSNNQKLMLALTFSSPFTIYTGAALQMQFSSGFVFYLKIV